MNRCYRLSRWLAISCCVAGLCFLSGCDNPQQSKNDDALKESVAALSQRVQEIEKKQDVLSETEAAHQRVSQAEITELRQTLMELHERVNDNCDSKVVEGQVQKVRRALQDVRQLAAICQSYSTDFGCYPAPPASPFLIYGQWPFSQVALLARQLAPDYTASLVGWDPWGSPYLYWASARRDHFAILCVGANKKPDYSPELGQRMKVIFATGVTGPSLNQPCFETDIVWVDSSLLQGPEGELRHCKDSRLN